MSHPSWSTEPATPPGSLQPGRRPVLSGPLWKTLAGLAVIVFLAVAVALWNSSAERRSIAALPDAQRAQAFAEGLARFRTLCGTPSTEDLGPECRRQARYLRLYPECDARCQDLTAGWLPQPTR